MSDAVEPFRRTHEDLTFDCGGSRAKVFVSIGRNAIDGDLFELITRFDDEDVAGSRSVVDLATGYDG